MTNYEFNYKLIIYAYHTTGKEKAKYQIRKIFTQMFLFPETIFSEQKSLDFTDYFIRMK